MRPTIVVIAACAILPGCNSPTGPSPLPTTVQASRTSGTLPPITVTATSGALAITGGIAMNEPCYNFSASAGVSGDSILVTLVATRRPTVCQQETAGFAYSISITGITAGTYGLRLTYDRRGYPTYVLTALQQPVEVP